MNGDLKECIERLQKIEKEKKIVDSRIGKEIVAFEEKIKYLRDDSQRLGAEVYTLGKDTVSIRLGDLINELSNLTGLDALNFSISTECNIRFSNLLTYSIEEIIHCIETHGCELYFADLHPSLVLKLYSNKNDCQYSNNKLFFYEIRFIVNRDNILEFLKYCNKKLKIDYYGAPYAALYIDEEQKLDDLIFNIPLCDLTGSSNGNWYPADLMKQAVINCVEKSNKKDASKSTGKKRNRCLTKVANR